MDEHMDVARSAADSVLDHVPMRNEDGDIRHEFVEEVAHAIEAGDSASLRACVAELHEADLGDLIGALEPDDRVRLVELTGRDFDFSALNELDEGVREEILEELPPETVAEGVRELESDDAVELLETLDQAEQEEILEKLPLKERVALERSLLYPENSAGRRMQTEFIAVPQDFTVGQAIDYMRETPDLPDRFYEIYVVDKDQHWQGAVPLDVLLRARRPVPLTELTDEDRRRVSVLEDQEEVARMFGKYNLVAAPVLDTQDRLVGVITVDDVVDVIEEEADEDLKALGGVTSDEELSDTFLTIARARFNWLLVNLATAFLASSVLGLFEGQLEKMVALAVLAPIVASQGGNAATQTMTVAVAGAGDARAGLLQCLARGDARGAGRSRQRARLRRDHGDCGGRLVQDPRPRHRHRPGDGVQPHRRCARRHPDPDGARTRQGRPRGGVGHVRHHGDGCGRVLLVSRHRDALVRAEVGFTPTSFRGAPLGASPESIFPHRLQPDEFRARASRAPE
ncbi:magnesium transporter [Bradyrhizobium ottawaense]